jgi:3-(3-hydroxy-phenyl)propionate hydroxylase
MSIDYQTLSFEYAPCREQSAQVGADEALYPVIVVGAGPVASPPRSISRSRACRSC